MREIMNLVRKIARSNVPVLIQGEIGVGKQTIAREIHAQSPRESKPFVHVLCGALHEPDIQERLFGHSGKGSAGVAGATSLLDLSREGTLFLDGVTQLPPWTQIQLLDVLQPDGDGGPRVIASSTYDVQTAVAENRFFSGLYYYLNAVHIEVPPLRHRPEDIRALAEHFLAMAVASLGRGVDKLPRHFSGEAWQALLEYDWPGNALQLAAVVAHAAMLAEGPVIAEAHLAGLLSRAWQNGDSEMISIPLAGGLKHMELSLINEVIHRCHGNKAAAARALHLHRRTLYRLLKEEEKPDG
jgi:DNA-binding NtrC family response regulator